MCETPLWVPQVLTGRRGITKLGSHQEAWPEQNNHLPDMRSGRMY